MNGWATIWIPASTKLSRYRMFSQRQAKKLWFGIGRVFLGLLPATALALKAVSAALTEADRTNSDSTSAIPALTAAGCVPLTTCRLELSIPSTVIFRQCALSLFGDIEVSDHAGDIFSCSKRCTACPPVLEGSDFTQQAEMYAAQLPQPAAQGITWYGQLFWLFSIIHASGGRR